MAKPVKEPLRLFDAYATENRVNIRPREFSLDPRKRDRKSLDVLGREVGRQLKEAVALAMGGLDEIPY